MFSRLYGVVSIGGKKHRALADILKATPDIGLYLKKRRGVQPHDHLLLRSPSYSDPSVCSRRKILGI